MQSPTVNAPTLAVNPFTPLTINRTTAVITLTQGYHALVDVADWPELSRWRWSALLVRNGRCYAKRGLRIGSVQSGCLLHRQLIGPDRVMEVDHKNGNGLDNRRSNLRISTASENRCNRGKQKDNSSGFKGVYFDRRSKKYCAQIKLRGKNKYIGSFGEASEAAEAYDTAAKELHGEFARTNF